MEEKTTKLVPLTKSKLCILTKGLTQIILFLILLISATLHLYNGVTQTILPINYKNETLREINKWQFMFLGNYAMFSPSQEYYDNWRKDMDLHWGKESIAKNSQYELWGKKEDGNFIKLPMNQFFPDPRDEFVQLHLRLSGGVFPNSLTAKGLNAEEIAGKEIIRRNNEQFESTKITAVYLKCNSWPVGQNSRWQYWTSPATKEYWRKLWPE